MDFGNFMEDKNDEIFVDEKGVRWKFISEKPCERKLKPRKLSFKIRFKVEFEMELTESQKPHKHIIREKEKTKYTDTLSKVLYGDFKDFGYSDCFQLEAISKSNVNVVQNKIIEDLFKDFPINYSFTDKEVFRNWEHYFIHQVEYLKKHLSKALKKVPNQLLKRFDNNLKNSSKSSFKADSAKFLKRISEIKATLRKEG